LPIQLVVEDLNASFDDKVVLHDVAVTAQPGHVLALMGKTGSGKSTFLRVINRMAEQRGAVVSGHIMLDNNSIFMQEPNEIRRKVGMVFTEPVLFAGSVLRNITAGLRLQGITGKQQLEERAEETLRRMEVYGEFRDLLYTDASLLARGQAQLICIARALALRPGLLLLDEPTRLLDAMTSIKVEDMLFNLRKDCTMVVAVHSPQMAGRIAEETAMMEDGTILEWGRTSDLFYHPRNLHTEQFISSKFA
jgi:phosphate transport system ATP-binding protein